MLMKKVSLAFTPPFLALFIQAFSVAFAQKVGIASDTALACWAAASQFNFGCGVPTKLTPINDTLIGAAHLNEPGSDIPIFSNCGTNSTYINTTVTAEDPYSGIRCQCMSSPFLQTFATCLRERVETFSPIHEGYEFFYRQCFYYADKSYSLGDLEEIYFNATNYMDSEEYVDYLEAAYDQTTNTNISYTSENKSAAINKMIDNLIFQNRLLTIPINISITQFDIQHRAACAAKSQYRLGSVYGILLVCYWSLIILIASIYRFIQQMYPEILLANNSTLNFLRKYLVLPATFRRHRSRPVKLLLNFYICTPTRGQSLLLLGYFILTLVFLFINYDIYEPNPMLPGYSNQILKYMGSRTGIIAFTQLPLVIVFGSRNSPLIWSTGWSYDTFQIYHRWTARVMMLMVVIHSGCFIAISFIGNTWSYRWEHIINWRFGNMATYSGIIMILTAVNRFRAKFYECFFLIHKIFFIIFLIGIARHCYDFGWMPWVYASIVLYFSERLFRFFKVFISGLRNRAYAEVYPDGVVKLSVKYSKRWPVSHGQYCYVRFLFKDMFWQAHPFSVYKSADEEVTTLQFCIAPQRGATRTLSDYLKQSPTKSALVPVMIEGPYGVNQDLDKFDTVMLLAGGVGITAIYSYAIHLKQYGLRYKGQKVVFMWIISNTFALEWFSEELLSLMGDDRFEIQIYITRECNMESLHKANHSIDEDEDEEIEWTGQNNSNSNVTNFQTQQDQKRHSNNKSLSGYIKNNYRSDIPHILQPDDKSHYQDCTACKNPIRNTDSNNSSQPNSRSLTPRQSSVRMLDIPKPPQLFNMTFDDSSTSLTCLLPVVGPEEVGHANLLQHSAGEKRVSVTTCVNDAPSELEPHLNSTSSLHPWISSQQLFLNPEANTSIFQVRPAQRIKSQFANLISDKRPDIKEEIAKCLYTNKGGLSSAYSQRYNLPGEQEYWAKKMEKKMNKKLQTESMRSASAASNNSGLYPGLYPEFSTNSLNPLCSVVPETQIGKSLAIISCGPPALVDSIRASIVEHLMDSEGRVEYFEEAFSW